MFYINGTQQHTTPGFTGKKTVNPALQQPVAVKYIASTLKD